ncbi:MAG: hypothetical protein NTW14_08190 [bacterium]|nr:hypothetical protein [bacterium]
MIKRNCRGKLCILVCAWLWVSGLLIMGKIIDTLNHAAPGMRSLIPNIDAIGSLQVFFVLYTIACFALYFTWQKLTQLNGEAKPSQAS